MSRLALAGHDADTTSSLATMFVCSATLRLSASRVSASCRAARLPSIRRLHSETLAQWIDSPKEANYKDTLHTERLADLFATLSTRDGTRKPYEVPRPGEPLPYGHHLTFFYPRSAEPNLRPDGTGKVTLVAADARLPVLDVYCI